VRRCLGPWVCVKQFTAAAALLLTGEGRLDLGAPVTEVNPGYLSMACWIPDRAASIVILLNDEALHTTDLLRQLLPVALEPWAAA